MKPVDVYVVAMPPNPKSAGQRALHTLCHKFRAVGVDARVSVRETYRWLDAPFASERAIGPTTLVVLPEVATEYPRGATRVIRWGLNYPGHCGSALTYPRSELVVAYSDALMPRVARAAGLTRVPVVNVATIEPSLFYDDGKRGRLYDVSYTGKSAQTVSVPKGTREITGAWPVSRQATARLLRGARRLYAYDTNSAICLEALVCGVELYRVQRGGWVRVRGIVPDVRAAWDDLTPAVRLLELADMKWPGRVRR